MNVKIKIIFTALMVYGVLVTCTIHETSAGEILVIAHPSVPAESLDQASIKNLFLGKTVQWDNSSMVTIVVSEKAEVHDMFLKKYVKRTKNQFRNVWRQNLFSGTGKQPIKANSIEELVDYVSKTDGAIGYISSDTQLPENIKVIAK